jgi:hypothetical protein
MIQIKNFDVDSAVIELRDVRLTEARRLFKDENSGLWYREFSFVDEQGRCVTIQAYAHEKEYLEIKERDF